MTVDQFLKTMEDMETCISGEKDWVKFRDLEIKAFHKLSDLSPKEKNRRAVRKARKQLYGLVDRRLIEKEGYSREQLDEHECICWAHTHIGG